VSRVLAACMAVTVLLLYAFLEAAHARVTISAPGFVPAPASVRLRVVVEPDDDNRILRVSADDGVHFRSSDVQIDGSAGPRTSFIEWRDLAAGDYELLARVGRTDGREWTARTVLRVVGQ
jgi:hypothetical protein